MEDLIEKIYSLPLEKKEYILKETERFVREDRETYKAMEGERIKRVMVVVCDTLGIGYDPSSRDRDQVMCRIFLSHIYNMQGVTDRKIAKMLHKDRCTIAYYRKMMQTWLDIPQYYHIEMKLWKQIQKAL